MRRATVFVSYLRLKDIVLTSKVQWFPEMFIGTSISSTPAKLSPGQMRRVLPPLLTQVKNAVFTANNFLLWSCCFQK